jgi:hypothetical protein
MAKINVYIPEPQPEYTSEGLKWLKKQKVLELIILLKTKEKRDLVAIRKNTKVGKKVDEVRVILYKNEYDRDN